MRPLALFLAQHQHDHRAGKPRRGAPEPTRSAVRIGSVPKT